MSTDSSTFGTQLYELESISETDTIVKYYVVDFALSSNPIRYYNISAIYRRLVTGERYEEADGAVKNAKAFTVGQLYRVETKENTVVYSRQDQGVELVENPHVGYVEVDGGYHYNYWANLLGPGALFYEATWENKVHLHYIAFSPTQYQIDDLFSADVTYRTQEKQGHQGVDTWDKYVESSGPLSDRQYVTLYADETAKADKLNGTFNWPWSTTTEVAFQRILPVEEMLSNTDVSFSQAEQDALKKCEWGLFFLETGWQRNSSAASATIRWTDVSEVSILRLEFISEGVTYNVGVVSDIVTGSPSPGGVASFSGGCSKMNWKTILWLIGGIVLAIILSPVLPYIVRFLIWVISFPVKAIASSTKMIKSARRQRKKQEGKQENSDGGKDRKGDEK